LRKPDIEVYTDGSCNPAYKVGAWVALIFEGKEKTLLQGKVTETTHQRMELLSVIKALEYIRNNYPDYNMIRLFSDSQYVVNLPERKEKLGKKNFLTKKGLPLSNEDLIRQLIPLTESLRVKFFKVKSHQKISGEENYNRTVDKLSRKIVRDHISGSE
jgi:ribonuclease HI